MSKPVLTLEAFADWCEKQPADKTYNWNDCRECACGQYAQSLGIQIWAIYIAAGGFWDAANIHAFDVYPKTFGKLASRLRAVSQP